MKKRLNYVVKRNGVYWPSAEMKKIAWVNDDKIYNKALKNPVKFWEDLANEGIHWEKQWTKTYEEKLPYFKWFVGGELNFCYNCLDRHLQDKADKVALIWVPESISEKSIKLTYKQLHEKVCKFANVLKKLGVKKGDVVSVYLPMIPEVIITMLACARIGAIHSVVFSAFAADALKARIEDGKAKILVTSDGYYRKGKKEFLIEKAKQAAKGTSIKKIVVVDRLGEKISGKKFVDFNKELEKAEKENKIQIMKSEDPLFILYTSGCCHGDSLVQFANGEIKKISDVVDKNKKDKITNIHSNPFVQTQDNITHLHKYLNNSVLYKIRTPSFETVLTPNHRLFSMNSYGEILEIEAGKLNKGDKIFVISKIDIKGGKQKLPLLKLKEDFRNKTTYMPENIPKIPSFLTPGFAQILGYLTGDGHADNRSIIFTDKDRSNLEFYESLINKELNLKGIIKKRDRQRLFINSSLFTSYIKEVFPDMIYRSRNREIPTIIQKSENKCIAGFLRGLFDAEGTIGHSFVKFSSTSEGMIRVFQLLLKRFGIIAQVYRGINKERKIRNHFIKKTEYLDIIISDRKSLDIFCKEIGFSDKNKKRRLKELIERLSLRRITPKERFPISSLLKEITTIIKVDWRGDFKKIIKYVHSNQADRNALILIRSYLDDKIRKIKDNNKIERLDLIRNKIQKLIDIDSVVLEKILEIEKVDNENDFVYDLTAEKNHNYIVNGIITHNTTGKPKGIVHDTGGYAVQAYWTAKWDFNLHDDDILWCTADVGWITGHSYAFYGPLLNGVTSLIYEGGPDFPDLGRWWKIIQENKINIFYTSPTAIRMFMKSDEKFIKKYNLDSLKILGTVGEPIDDHAWNWYFKNIGKGRCPLIDTWWQTETGGILITALPGIGPFVPTVAGRSFPGVNHIVVSDKGKENKKGELGFLVQTSPFAPGMLHGVYKNHKKYVETYWRFKKYYDTSDGAYMKNKLIRITGRTDDVMKVAGHRLATAELEDAINRHKKINECAVVPIPHDIKGQVPVAFVVLNKGEGSEDLEKDIKSHVDKTLGPTARPAKVYFVKDLPKTRSGKIMRRILKNLLAKEEPQGLMTLVNPDSVDEIKKTIEKIGE